MALLPLRPPEETSDPAPALTRLHEARRADGRLTRGGLESVATSLRLPLVDLYDAATFYHYFAVGDDAEPVANAVCAGPTCSLHNGQREDPATSGDHLACPGLCDQPVPTFDGRVFGVGLGDGGFTTPRPVDHEEALFRHLREDGDGRLDAYRRSGGYAQLSRVVDGSLGMEPALETLASSGLTGRGGAAFPLAAKWRAVREAAGDLKYVVCNADEGEPGTFKDRPLLHLSPHLLLEGMAIAGALTGATVGIIYLRFEYPEAEATLLGAIREAEEAGVLGTSVLGSGRAFRVWIKRGAGSYVCGEETSLLNSLEGIKPWPRERPPFPTTHGLWGRPTVINNVESFCAVPPIFEKGADWFRGLGRGDNAGTKLYSVSGDVKRPGNFELPLGITASELIEEYAGGPTSDRNIKAFTLGGISGGLLGAEHLGISLDNVSNRDLGVALGSGGVVVLDDSRCAVAFVRNAMSFYEDESCGRCFPCRIGTVRLRELLDGLTGHGDLPGDALQRMNKIGTLMAATSACGLGQAAPLVVTGLFRSFREEVEEHMASVCRAAVCEGFATQRQGDA